MYTILYLFNKKVRKEAEQCAYKSSEITYNTNLITGININVASLNRSVMYFSWEVPGKGKHEWPQKKICSVLNRTYRSICVYKRKKNTYNWIHSLIGVNQLNTIAIFHIICIKLHCCFQETTLDIIQKWQKQSVNHSSNQAKLQNLLSINILFHHNRLIISVVAQHGNQTQ